MSSAVKDQRTHVLVVLQLRESRAESKVETLPQRVPAFRQVHRHDGDRTATLDEHR